MSVSTLQVSVSYNGTGTAGPFTIPFPFLDTSYIYASIAPTAEGMPVLQPTSAYTVTRNADGSGGSLMLTTPIVAPKVLIIFRQTPLTQPTVFQSAGPFPAKANETGLDRLCMQVQEVAAAVAGGGSPVPGTSTGTATWANPTARGSTAPEFVGQLGVEESTQTVWIGQSTALGAWQQFDPRFRGNFILGCFSNTGYAEADADGAAARLSEWNCDAILAVGDISVADPPGIYDGHSNYDNDWARFQSWINAGSAFPALGDAELDFDGWAARQATKFPYLAAQNGSRYYKVTLGGGLIDLFVLNSGVDSAGDLLEPDGNDASSVQHAWFAAAAAASTARWRIAAFHISPTTLNQDIGQILAAMAWPELAQMDLICCGHVHAMEYIRRSDALLVNTSTLIQSDGNFGATLNGSSSTSDRALWATDEGPMVARIVATENLLEVQAYRTTGACLNSRLSVELGKPRQLSEKFMLVAPGIVIGAVGSNFFMGRIIDRIIPRRIAVSVVIASASPIAWQCFVDGTQIAGGTLAANATYMTADCTVNTLFASGQVITFTVPSGCAATGLDVTLFYESLK